MQDQVLSCAEALGKIQAGESGPALAAHLAGCERCLESFLEEALREPATVSAPAEFKERVLARLPASSDTEWLEYRWWAVAAVLFAALGALLWWSGALPGLVEALARPAVLAAASAIEAAFALLWLWAVISETG